MPSLEAKHSALFLFTRIIILLCFGASFLSAKCRSAFIALSLGLSLEQIIRFFRWKRRTDDVRKLHLRYAKFLIHDANGAVGKLVGAVTAYVINFRREPQLINLLHWLDVAVQRILYIEGLKLYLALHRSLKYHWDYLQWNLNIDASSEYCQRFKNAVEEFRSSMVRRLNQISSRYRKQNAPSHLSTWALAPSTPVWLYMLTHSREQYWRLGSNAREHAYHIDSIVRHRMRTWRQRNGLKNVHAIMFGVDMTDDFRKGTSRVVEVGNEVDRNRLVEQLYSGRIPPRADPNEEIDQNSVYAISYRHLGDKQVEAETLTFALQLIDLIAASEGHATFRVWCDKCLRASPGRTAKLWSQQGLLMYAYYKVIAVRNVTEDDENRMWPLAEERLAYCARGVLRLDTQTGAIEWLMAGSQSLHWTPENSVRVYLRYLKTGEAQDEQTFHLSDKQNFGRLADAFGLVDDEQDILQGLRGSEVFRDDSAVEVDQIWWAQVIDTESYAELRARDYEKVWTMPTPGRPYFDGYRQWFKYKEEYLMESRLHKSMRCTSAWHISDKGQQWLLLNNQTSSGLVRRSAVLLLGIIKHCEVFEVMKSCRVKLRYKNCPTAHDILRTVCEHEGWSKADVKEVNLVHLKLLAKPCADRSRCNIRVSKTCRDTSLPLRGPQEADNKILLPANVRDNVDGKVDLSLAKTRKDSTCDCVLLGLITLR